MIFVAPIRSLRYSRARSTKNENRCLVHFIILKFETSVENNRLQGRRKKGDRDRMRRKHDRTQSILLNNFFYFTK
jgi:hypothetical protein